VPTQKLSQYAEQHYAHTEEKEKWTDKWKMSSMCSGRSEQHLHPQNQTSNFSFNPILPHFQVHVHLQRQFPALLTW